MCNYKLIIPQVVEDKIRLWCCMNPNTEWSGTLFYRSHGSFEEDNLTLSIADFYVQDVGTSTYTDFEEDADMVTYMMENDLLDCISGLVH